MKLWMLWLINVAFIMATPAHGADWWARDLLLLGLGVAGGYLWAAKNYKKGFWQ